MKYLDEYRDAEKVHRLAAAIRRITTQPHTLMEVCGGQTHAILKYGIDELLPDGVQLIHGPGCPVCVTPVELIDKAVALAQQRGIILCSFGDMLRVPGSQWDLFTARAHGGDVRMVYSPLDALRLAQQHPDKQVIFFAVGFETTAPANALSVFAAREKGIKNYSILSAHVLVPPAIEAILTADGCKIQGFLAAGHVCTVMGWHEYPPIAAKYHVPIVVTGFEPVDILQGVYRCILQREQGRAEVENQYARAVTREGNQAAKRLMHRVFERCDRTWRGIGMIPQSGLRVRKEFIEFDAEQRFCLEKIGGKESPDCIAGLVLQGIRTPHECPAFGTRCTPEHPLGAPMVSSEGACAAYYRYRLHKKTQQAAQHGTEVVS